MIEGERIAVKLFPICFEYEMLKLLELRGTRIWCQDLEIDIGSVEITRKADQLLNALFGIL